jgi:FkbM family methyltransferase
MPTIPLHHQLITQWCRSGHHPGKLRCIAACQHLLNCATIQVAVSPGVVMELDPSDYVQREILFNTSYEPKSLARFKTLVHAARGVVDFGAHMGLYTLHAAAILSAGKGRVLAVEPTPSHAAALLRNAALSGLRNIDLCTAAIASKPGLSRMVTSHAHNSGGTRLGKSLETDHQLIPLHVPVCTAALLAPLLPDGRADVIKLDVEGREFEILRSLLPTLSSPPKDLLFEYNTDLFPEHHQPEHLAWLQDCGYRLRTVEGLDWDGKAPLVEGNLWARRI